jgi:hypothetical protein
MTFLIGWLAQNGSHQSTFYLDTTKFLWLRRTLKRQHFLLLMGYSSSHGCLKGFTTGQNVAFDGSGSASSKMVNVFGLLG